MKATEIYYDNVEDISVDETRSDTSTSEVEITDRFRQFCWY
jgi:hypothetical protein